MQVQIERGVNFEEPGRAFHLALRLLPFSYLFFLLSILLSC